MALADEQHAAAPSDLPEEARSDYTVDELKALGAKGHAFKNPDGSFSFPITDLEELHDAIRAVGRSGADHDKVRAYIIGRAKDLGAEDQLPDNWNADGSLKQENQRRKRRHRAVPLMREVRHFRAVGLDARALADGELRTAIDDDTDTILITGAPIVYDQPYTVHDMFGSFRETMCRGVASRVIANGADVRLLINHDGIPLARTVSGTLTLRDTPEALRFEARLDARQAIARDLAIAIIRGDVSQMSCGFIVARDEWNADRDERRVEEFEELLDISAVTYPASPTTSIEVVQRMLAQTPVESRARLRQLYLDSRAGKTLSAANQQKIMDATKALHAVLIAAGYDPGELVHVQDPNSESEHAGENPAGDLKAQAETSSGDTTPDDEPAASDEDAQPMPIPPEATVHDPPIIDGQQPPNLSQPHGLDPMRAIGQSGEQDGEPNSGDDGTTATGFSGPPGSPGWDDATGTRGRRSEQERREAAESWNDKQRAIAQALADRLMISDPCNLFILDMGDDWAVIEKWSPTSCDLLRVQYALNDDGTATITSDPVPVIAKTLYEPAPQPGSRASYLRLRAEVERRRRNRA